jgi:hypothetical protein
MRTRFRTRTGDRSTYFALCSRFDKARELAGVTSSFET